MTILTAGKPSPCNFSTSLSHDCVVSMTAEGNPLLRDRILLQEKVRKIRDGAAEAAKLRNSMRFSADSKHESKREHKQRANVKGSSGESDEEDEEDEKDEKNANSKCKLVLTCFQPEGSPLHG